MDRRDASAKAAADKAADAMADAMSRRTKTRLRLGLRLRLGPRLRLRRLCCVGHGVLELAPGEGGGVREPDCRVFFAFKRLAAETR